jgi:crossover junction endodeoxyribonuclease RuvC
MRTLYVGIDPGVTGGIAWFSKDSGAKTLGYNFLSFCDTERATKQLAKDLERLCQQHEAVHIVIEKVGASPKMPSVSAFSFGRNVGTWEGFLCFLPNIKTICYVQPAVWQAALGCQAGGDKTKLHQMQKGRNRMPGLSNTKDISDAISLAEYCIGRF